MVRRMKRKRIMAIVLASFVLMQQLGVQATVSGGDVATVSSGDVAVVSDSGETTVSSGDVADTTVSGGDGSTVSDGDGSVSEGDNTPEDTTPPELKLTLKAGEEEVPVGSWYSEAIESNEGKTLVIYAEAKDSSTIKEIKFFTDKACTQEAAPLISAKEAETDGTVQIKECVITGEQNQKYYVRATDSKDNTITKSIQVKIDNTAPKDEVLVAFCGTKDMLVEFKDSESGVQEYVFSKKEGTVYDKEKISLELTAEDGETDSKISSGIGKVSFVLETREEVTGEVKREAVSLEAAGNNKSSVRFVLPDRGEEIFEKSFRICDLVITDKAGNTYPESENGQIIGMQDQVVYYVDNKAPEVMYRYGTETLTAGSVEETEEGKVQYFNEPFTSQVSITDANLTQAGVANVTVEGNAQAEIIRESQGEEDMFKTVDRFRYILNEEGSYQLCTVAEDLLHNGTEKKSDTIVVDTTAPEVSVFVCDNTGAVIEDYADRYFSENMTVRVQIKDRYLDTESVEAVILSTSISGEDTSIVLEPGNGTWEDGVYTNEYQLTGEGCYRVQVNCKDKAGNTGGETTEAFYMDKTAPVVEIVYDKKEAKNKFYYNSARTATVTVTDYFFDTTKAEFMVKSVYGNQPVIGEWQHAQTENNEPYTYSVTVRFEEDDVYDFSFSCTDQTGQQSEPVEEEHFVIDKTAPVVEYQFDYNEASHEHFYNQARTATIAIDDISFEEQLVEVTKGEHEKAESLPALTEFSGKGRVHTASMKFEKDGVYQFAAQAEDLAGNKAEVVSCPLFVLDMTAPEVILSGVENFSANNKVVQAKLEYRDKYLYDADTFLQITGYENGIVSRNFTKEALDEGYLVSFEDFPYTQDMDDLYTMQVLIKDYAGNETKEELVFSVNRFGSVYVLTDATKEALAGYYLAQPAEIVITEINVDDLQTRQITGSRDGETVTFVEKEDYTVHKQGTETTWKSYSYVLPADNFEKEGHYAVTVSSYDKANNSSDNHTKGTEINFAHDCTAPSIVVSGLENQGVYNTNELTVRTDIQDNMGVNLVTVFEEEQVLLEYDAAKLSENYGAFSFTLEEKEEPRDIRIVAMDMAGNEQEQTYEEVLVTTIVSPPKEDMPPMAAAVSSQTQVSETVSLGWLLIPIVSAIPVGTVVWYLMKRNKRSQ